MKPLLVVALLAGAVLPAAAAPRLFVAPHADANAVNPKSGYVVAALGKGRFARLSRTARCWNVQRSPDGRSWAWIEGEVKDLERETQTLYPTRIVVWRNRAAKAARGTVIQPGKAYELLFRWNDAGHIAVASRGRHGATHLQLFDARSGRSLGHHSDYEANLPDWAKAIDDL